MICMHTAIWVWFQENGETHDVPPSSSGETTLLRENLVIASSVPLVSGKHASSDAKQRELQQSFGWGWVTWERWLRGSNSPCVSSSWRSKPCSCGAG